MRTFASSLLFSGATSSLVSMLEISLMLTTFLVQCFTQRTEFFACVYTDFFKTTLLLWSQVVCILFVQMRALSMPVNQADLEALAFQQDLALHAHPAFQTGFKQPQDKAFRAR